MLKKILILLQQIIFAVVLIYTYNSLSISICSSIPINFLTVSLITLFGFFAMFQLIIFSYYI